MTKYLGEESAAAFDHPKVDVDEKTFRWELNQDPMANDKLAEGIRKFAEGTNTPSRTVVPHELTSGVLAACRYCRTGGRNPQTVVNTRLKHCIIHQQYTLFYLFRELN